MLPINVSNLKALFFDLDDVLVFSEILHTKAWQLSLSQRGVDPEKIDFDSLVGVAEVRQAALFKEQFQLKGDLDELIELKRKTYIELTKNGLESATGRNLFLEKLSMSFVIGVVSSSIQRVVQHVLSSENIASFFHFIIAFDDCDKHKPDPLPYQKALEKAYVLPHEALVIEDSRSGITAAQKANIPVIGLFKNQRADQMVEGVPYFKSFCEIHDLIFSTRVV